MIREGLDKNPYKGKWNECPNAADVYKVVMIAREDTWEEGFLFAVTYLSEQGVGVWSDDCDSVDECFILLKEVCK